MVGRRRLLSLGMAAAFAAVAGTAWAVTQDRDGTAPAGPVPTSGELAQGRAPSGATYTISGIAPSALGESRAAGLCTQITTPAGGTQGCDPVPEADGRIHGQPWRPSFALLGNDRFFTAVAPQGVTAMEVQVQGEGEATPSRAIGAGSAGTLLVVVVGGPTVTSRDPASSRDYEVRLLDEGGETVRKITMSDPG